MDEKHLLKILEKDPGIRNEDLADMLQVSTDEIKGAKKRLEEKGIILGYRTVVNWDAAGANDRCTAIIMVSAKPEREAGYDRVADKIARFQEVRDLYLMSGTAEFMVFVECRTMREISDFVAQKLAPIEGVTATVTCFQLQQYKVAGMRVDAGKKEDERMLVEP